MRDDDLNNSGSIGENTDLFSFTENENQKNDSLFNEDKTFEEPLDIEEELNEIRKSESKLNSDSLPIREGSSEQLKKKITIYNKKQRSENLVEDDLEDKYEDDFEDDLEDELEDESNSSRSSSVLSGSKKSKNFESKPPKKGKKVLKIVSISGIFLILVTVIGFQFLLLLDNYKDNNKSDNADKVADLPIVNDVEEDIEDKFTEPIVVEDTLNLEVNETTGLLNRSSVYKSDLSDYVLFKIGFVTEEGFNLPVSVLISKDKVKEDFEISDLSQISQFDLYSRYSNSALYKSLGFIEYHPYIGEFFDSSSYISVDGDEESPYINNDSVDESSDYLVLRLNNDSKLIYDNDSVSSSVLFTSLNDTFNGSYSKILFEDSEGNKYNFINGNLSSSVLDLSNDLNNYSSFLYKNSLGNTFLGNNLGKLYDDVIEALEIMKKSPNEFNKSLIPDGIDYSITLEDNIVTVKFIDELDVTNYSSKELLGMIEGLNLTVSGFDKSLKLENIKQSLWQGFNFGNVLERPLGANKIILK